MMQKRSLNTFFSSAHHLVTAAVLLFLVLAACERRPLELYDDGKVNVHFTFDWVSQYAAHYKQKPEGMTFMLAKDGDVIYYSDPMHQVDELTIPLAPGTYMMTVINNTFSEFGNLEFYGRGSHGGLRTEAVKWMVHDERAWDNERNYAYEPNEMGVVTDTFTVPRTLDDIEFYDYRMDHQGHTQQLERQELVWPMTTKLYITVKVIGIQYMNSVEGFITGMADGFHLNHVWRDASSMPMKVNFAAEYDPDDKTVGWLHGELKTFGLPAGQETLNQRSATSNVLNLHFTSIDRTTHNFTYQVGKVIRYREGDQNTFRRHDVTRELELVIAMPNYNDIDVPHLPYAQPDGTGMFDAEVEPWTDTENIDVTF